MHRSDISLLSARLFVKYHEDFKYRALVDVAPDRIKAMMYESALGITIIVDSNEYNQVKQVLTYLFRGHLDGWPVV